ncbi:MAG: hypothetical protein NTY65_03660 [Planctomycetota bacterium]|nr:hypothetical protein [Planctomycetota bacterium]
MESHASAPAAAAVAQDYYYNESWQCLEERAGGTSAVQNLWDIRYIDAPALRWRDADKDANPTRRKPIDNSPTSTKVVKAYPERADRATSCPCPLHGIGRVVPIL